MAWVNEVWGWGGWIIVALLPLSFWAFIAVVLVLVFGKSATVEVPEPKTARQPATAPDVTRDTSALGWRPPVPQHH